MRRITIQARQLQPGDSFSLRHHDLYQGEVETVDVKPTKVTVTATGREAPYVLEPNHPVTITRQH